LLPPATGWGKIIAAAEMGPRNRTIIEANTPLGCARTAAISHCRAFKSIEQSASGSVEMNGELTTLYIRALFADGRGS
jgi:hypothetical protein